MSYYACLNDTRLRTLAAGEKRIDKYCPNCAALACAFDNLPPEEHIYKVLYGPAEEPPNHGWDCRVDRLDASDWEERVEQVYRVLAALDDWTTSGEVARLVGMADRRRLVGSYLARLRKDGRAEMRGKGKQAEWRGVVDGPL